MHVCLKDVLTDTSEMVAILHLPECASGEPEDVTVFATALQMDVPWFRQNGTHRVLVGIDQLLHASSYPNILATRSACFFISARNIAISWGV